MKKKITKSVKNFIKYKIPTYFVSSKFLSSVYYLVFSTQFKREQFAVLNGKVKHQNELLEKKASVYTLVRNIHRLEKGLLMIPRRDVFAVDFIAETVDAFKNVWSFDKMSSDKQYKWFYDVLESFFATVGDHPIINRESLKYHEIISNSTIELDDQKSIPYCRLETSRPNINFDEFYKLTKYRRSVRWFIDKEVPRELVDKAIMAANQSPSACNRQPFQYRIIDDKEMLKKVARLPMGVRGYVEGIKMMIVVVGNLDAYFDERDRHVIYIDASLANMTLMFALETLGLSSCAINWPDIENLEKGMDSILRLEKHQRPIMCIAVGYSNPEGMVAFSEKRNLDDLRVYN